MVAAAWRSVVCPTCGAAAGASYRSIYATRARPHRARLREAMPPIDRAEAGS